MKQEKKSVSKKTLLSSVIVLVVCIAMLLGTTFAWFTDSVSNTGNRIQAGRLKIDLLMYKDIFTTADKYDSIAGGTGDIFKESTVATNSNVTLWEPGKTQVVFLAVENKGNLALKYNAFIDVIDEGLCDNPDTEAEDSSLECIFLGGVTQADYAAAVTAGTITDWTSLVAYAGTLGVSPQDVKAGRSVISTGVLDEIAKSTENERDYLALAVHMKEDAGNVFQGKDAIIDVVIKAAQMTAEEDGFGSDQYDSGATIIEPPTPIHKKVTSGEKKKSEITGDVIVKTTTDDTVKATVNKDSALTILNQIMPIEQQGESSDTTLVLNLTVDTTNNTEASITYEVGMDGTVTTVKAGETTTNSMVIHTVSAPVEVVVNVGKGLKNVKVSHNGTPMTEASTKADQTYSYNSSSGKLYIYTASFSPFTVTYQLKSPEDYDLKIEKTGEKTTYMNFADFRDSVNAGNTYEGYTVTLLKDVDLKNENWIPIGEGSSYGDDSKAFKGTFNGNSKEIKNLKAIAIDGKVYNPGLFGALSGNVNSLTIRGESQGAGLAYFICGTCTIENVVSYVNVSDVMSYRTSTESHIGGGIGAHVQGGTGTEPTIFIKNCKNYGTLNNGFDNGSIGGMAGHCYGNAKFINCDNNGTIYSVTYLTGGIVGYANGTSYQSVAKTFFENCVNSGNITTIRESGTTYTYTQNLGGILGYATQNLIIVDGCTNNGNIGAIPEEPTYHVGAPRVGGIVGQSTGASTIKNCLNDGSITGETDSNSYGGIVGLGSQAILDNNTNNATNITVNQNGTTTLSK